MRPVRFLLFPSDELLQRGIPPHSGLSYSICFGLIVEGILSACYHLCPTRMNYQFGNNERATTTDYRVILSSGSFLDTSFMYVIAVLCTLKLYHARHADINKSYMAYIDLALLVLLGAGTTFTSEFYFKLGFTVVHNCLRRPGHRRLLHGPLKVGLVVYIYQLRASDLYIYIYLFGCNLHGLADIKNMWSSTSTPAGSHDRCI